MLGSRKVQKNEDGLELNAPSHVLVYPNDAKLLGENINSINNNTNILL
jgi:hypothetical protein